MKESSDWNLDKAKKIMFKNIKGSQVGLDEFFWLEGDWRKGLE